MFIGAGMHMSTKKSKVISTILILPLVLIGLNTLRTQYIYSRLSTGKVIQLGKLGGTNWEFTPSITRERSLLSSMFVSGVLTSENKSHVNIPIEVKINRFNSLKSLFGISIIINPSGSLVSKFGYRGASAHPVQADIFSLTGYNPNIDVHIAEGSYMNGIISTQGAEIVKYPTSTKINIGKTSMSLLHISAGWNSLVYVMRNGSQGQKYVRSELRGVTIAYVKHNMACYIPLIKVKSAYSIVNNKLEYEGGIMANTSNNDNREASASILFNAYWDDASKLVSNQGHIMDYSHIIPDHAALEMSIGDRFGYGVSNNISSRNVMSILIYITKTGLFRGNGDFLESDITWNKKSNSILINGIKVNGGSLR